MFADDTNIFIADKDIIDVYRKSNKVLNCVYEYFYQKPINRLLVLTGGKVSNNKQVTLKRQTCY